MTSHEYNRMKLMRIRRNTHELDFLFFQDAILQELEGTGLSIGAWCMKQLNTNQYLDITFMFLLHEMTKVFKFLEKEKKLFLLCICVNTHQNCFCFLFQDPYLVVSSPQNQHSTKNH